MSGNTHEVVSAYESAMARGDQNTAQQHRGSGSKGHFLKWEITEPQGGAPHILRGLGPVTVKFTADIRQPIRRGHYGVALRNHEQQVIWAWAVQPLELETGERELCHTFPMLPLRPGPYTWLAALYDEGDLVDWWDCAPEMVVATEVYQHPQDEWNSVLNIPSRFAVHGMG
jgi:hypothetical protein